MMYWSRPHLTHRFGVLYAQAFIYDWTCAGGMRDGYCTITVMIYCPWQQVHCLSFWFINQVNGRRSSRSWWQHKPEQLPLLILWLHVKTLTHRHQQPPPGEKGVTYIYPLTLPNGQLCFFVVSHDNRSYSTLEAVVLLFSSFHLVWTILF